MEKRISLITVYNNEKLVLEMQQSAAAQQGVTLDCVMLDNRCRQYKSAAEALNAGARLAVGDVLVFLHQDIEFLSDGALEFIYDYAQSNKNVVFGAAGVKKREGSSSESLLLSSMCAGPDKARYDCLDGPTDAFTLDECLIACHRSCMEKIVFDEDICDGWHLYGADLCLQAQALAGLSVQVIPIDCWHKSNGYADKAYFECQNRLAKKYSKYYKIINTTNGYAYTNPIKRFLQNAYRRLKY